MIKSNHLRKIVAIAEELSSLGLHSQADIINSHLKKIAKAPYDVHDDSLYPQEEGANPYVSPETVQKDNSKAELDLTDFTYTKWKPSLDDKKNYSTGEIPFKWGRYSARFKSEVYYVSSEVPSNYLGKIQVPGDPFTYDLAGNKIKIISAPHAKRHLIGRLISRSDVPEKYLSAPTTTPKESPSQEAFVEQPRKNLDFYLQDSAYELQGLAKLYPNYKEQIFRLSKYSGIRSYLNEMRTEYPEWREKFVKENIEDMDPELIALDLLEYLNLHPMIDDYFMDKLPGAIKVLKDSNLLLDAQ